MTKFEIKQQSFKKKQLALVKKCKNSKCLILKGGYYYRDDYKGYTEQIQQAGVYEVNVAFSHVTSCSYTDFITIVPIDTEKHNALIIKHIKQLTAHLI